MKAGVADVPVGERAQLSAMHSEIHDAKRSVYEFAFETSRDATLVVDTRGRVVRRNRSARALPKEWLERLFPAASGAAEVERFHREMASRGTLAPRRGSAAARSRSTAAPTTRSASSPSRTSPIAAYARPNVGPAGGSSRSVISPLARARLQQPPNAHPEPEGCLRSSCPPAGRARWRKRSTWPPNGRSPSCARRYVWSGGNRGSRARERRRCPQRSADVDRASGGPRNRSRARARSERFYRMSIASGSSTPSSTLWPTRATRCPRAGG